MFLQQFHACEQCRCAYRDNNTKIPYNVGLDLNLAGPSQLQQSGLLLSGGHGSGHKRQRTSNDDDDPTGEPHQCKHAYRTH